MDSERETRSEEREKVELASKNPNIPAIKTHEWIMEKGETSPSRAQRKNQDQRQVAVNEIMSAQKLPTWFMFTISYSNIEFRYVRKKSDQIIKSILIINFDSK